MNNELIIYYGMTVRKNGMHYFLNGAFGRYVDELSNYYKTIRLVLPTYTNDSKDDEYCIQSNNVVLHELPFYDGIVDAQRKRKEILLAIQSISVMWNSPIIIRWPTPFFKTVAEIAKKKQLPICYHLVGDPEAVVTLGTKYSGIHKLIAVAYAKYLIHQTKKAIVDYPVLVNGSGLRRMYKTVTPRIKEIRTSTFYEHEIVYRERSIDLTNIKLLYVGYLRHEKGLDFLLKAVKELRDRKISITLTIVGVGDIESELKKETNDLSIADIVTFKGYIPVGERLFYEYSKADIFLLPSISEGTPRVLLEAMSRGAAVIATNTGGIPFTISDRYNGLLIPPQNTVKIVEAVEQLVYQPELYNNIVKNGYSFAYLNTVEHHAKEVHDFIEAYCLGYEKYEYIEQHNRWLRFVLQSIPIRIIQLITGLLPNSEPTNRFRGVLMRPFFKNAGKGLQIASGVIINRIDQVNVGSNVYFSHNVWLNGTGGVTIEDDTIIGPFSVVASTEHSFKNGKVSNSGTIVAPIRIKTGSWVASHAVITAGVCIGKGCLIGSNAVVTHDTDDGCMYGGIPARKLKELN